MSTGIDLLSNWSDITYSGDQIRFATTALNEIYVDFAKEDEIIMDKASSWFSYKRKDGQYIRPDYERFSYSNFLRDLMSCTRDTFKLNKSDWEKRPSFVWYNYNPSYNNEFLNVSATNQNILINNKPQFYCDATASAGFFVKLNTDKDSMAYLGIYDDHFSYSKLAVGFIIYIVDTKGNEIRTAVQQYCVPNQYLFIDLSSYINSNTDHFLIELTHVKFTRTIKDGTINSEDEEVIGALVNGGNLVISSFDIVTQMYLDNTSGTYDTTYRYRTQLHRVLTPIKMGRIESPGKLDVSADTDYIYPCKLNLIVPEPKIDNYMRIDQINCIPKEKGTLTDSEEAFFCDHLDDEPYAVV